MAAERCHGATAAMLVAAVLAPLARATAPSSPRRAPPAVELPLLEFLGASDPTHDARKSDNGSWMEYLSQLNLGKTVPGASARAPAKPKSPGDTPAAKKEHG